MLQFKGSQRVGRDLVTKQSHSIHIHSLDYSFFLIFIYLVLQGLSCSICDLVP